MVTARHLAKLLFLVSGAYLYRFRRSAEPADADRVPQEASETGRGRDAETPSELGTRGWRDILLRVYAPIAEDNLWVIAAGVAFYALLSLFPGIAPPLPDRKDIVSGKGFSERIDQGGR